MLTADQWWEEKKKNN